MINTYAVLDSTWFFIVFVDNPWIFEALSNEQELYGLDQG
jgi:hypothetical protein